MAYQNQINEIARIKCDMTRDTATAVLDLGLWDKVRDFKGRSFAYMPGYSNILNHTLVSKHNLSGGMFGCCMWNVQFIAKNGIEAFQRK